MCIIAVCSARRLTRADIDLMTAANPDGIGVGWIDVKEGAARWRKGLSEKDAAKLADTLPYPYLVHARMATVGAAMPGLAHPFPIARVPMLANNGSAARILAHNGHVSDWRAILSASGAELPTLADDRWSDTRGIAAAVARAGYGILDELHGNRFVVMDARAAAAAERVRMWGSWIEDAGISWSCPLLPRSRAWMDYPFGEAGIFGPYDDVLEGSANGKGAWRHKLGPVRKNRAR